MELSTIVRKGIKIRTQPPGLPEGGPITPSLKAMSCVESNCCAASGKCSSTQDKRPISPVGFDLAQIVANRRIQVIFVHTSGEGIALWRGLIILDSDYMGEGQIRSPAKIGLVAHELTHVLQREFNNPHYWPGGGLRPTLYGRWIGDSTNFMEVLSYLVGWTVEYDLINSCISSSSVSLGETGNTEKRLASLRDRIATLAVSDSHSACHFVLRQFPEHPIYRQNFRVENRSQDRRIPPGSWHYWLRQMGFSRQAVDHIMILAAQGHPEKIDPAQVI